MKAMSNFLIVILCTIMLFSCKKSDDAVTTTTTVAQKTLLSRVVYSAVGTYDYTYDSQNRMRTENYSGNASNPATLTTFTGYDADGKVNSFNVHSPAAAFPDNNILNIFNSNGKLDKQFTYNENGVLIFSSVFTYAGSLVTIKQYNGGTVLTSTTEYTMSADGKNVTQYKTYNGAGTLTFTTVYSYFDQQKSIDGLYPYGASTLPNSQNNWLNLSRTNNSTSAVTNIATTFQYNSDGYPLHRSADNGSTIDYTYIKR